VGILHESLPLTLNPVEDFTDAKAMAAVIRVTGGNWRLLHRLMAQVERLLQINGLHTITKEVVEAARENLIIGQV
jgi:DNA transposition AAA+ family ATPase